MAEAAGAFTSDQKDNGGQSEPKPISETMNGAPPPGGYQFKIDPIQSFAAGYLTPNPITKDQENRDQLNRIYLPSDPASQGALGMASSLYGTNLAQIGAENRKIIEARGQAAMNPGESPYIQMMKQERNDAIRASRANAGQAGQGGGVQAGRERQMTRESNRDIASEQARFQEKAMSDYQQLMARVTGTTMSLPMQQRALELSGEYQAPSQAGITVICGELFRQGLLPLHVYAKDQEFGQNLIENDPEAYIGYYVWARHIVSGMKKSKALTKVVAMFALPWAKNIAGEKNLLGGLLLKVGLPVCRVIGTISLFMEKKKHGNC